MQHVLFFDWATYQIDIDLFMANICLSQFGF
jgi:hypothetical protein